MKPFEILSNSLNPPQKEAVETLQGPHLILAGAGSGKTRVLTYRTANLIAQGLASAEEIFAVTFTNKAAKEMESRIVSLLRQIGVPIYDRMWIGTFHSLCARILRDHIHLLEYQPHFGIYDSADQLSMIKKVLTALNIDDKMYPAKSFQARINNAKSEGLRPDEALKRRHLLDDKSHTVYVRYEEEMKRANSLDFGDLLLKTYELFEAYPVVLEQYQSRFRYLMVDEYQDTNRIQYLLVQKLAAAHRNLCVVGDEDQSIYSWRGADITNILNFEKDFPEAKVVKLEQNYRSTKNIVSAATYLIQNNSQRKDKTLFTDNAAGDLIQIREENNEYDEARFVVREVEAVTTRGEFSNKDVAVFYRTNAQSRVLEEQFRSRGIPYKMVGGTKFYERMEIKDILAYMKLLLNPTDDISFKRIINVPARGIGKTTVDRLEEFSAQHKLGLLEGTAKAIDLREFNVGGTRKLREFLNLLEGLQLKAKTASLPELYLGILDATRYVIRLKEENTPEAESRIENLEEFNNAITKFAEERGEEATLQTFLEEMSLVSDVDALDEADNGVTMMTLHISKGLEFPVVFIVGMEEGLFPHTRTELNNPEDLEEERRLAYVGMTRAEKKLFLTYARTRKVWGTDQYNPPSRFLKELPEHYVQFQTSSQRPRFMQNMERGGSRDNYGNDNGYGGGFGKGRSARAANNSWDSGDRMPNYEDFGDGGNDFDFDWDSGSSKKAPAKGSSTGGYSKGMRVRHPSYGVGSIFSVEGSGDNLKVSVLFSDNTLKKFVAKYARLEQV